jgi:Integrase core domain
MSPASANFASNSNNPSKKKKKSNGKKADKPSASTPMPTPKPDGGCDYCHKTNHIVEDCYALKYKKFYEMHNPPLYSKKNSKRNDIFPAVGTVAGYESASAYSSVEEAPLSSALQANTFDNFDTTWVVDSGASDYIVSSRTCFHKYSTDVPGPKVVNGLTGDTQVLGIGNVKLVSENGNSIELQNALHANVPYNLLSIGRLTMAGCKVTFEGPFCHVENANTGFHIKCKFAPSFGARSYLYRFRTNFSSVPPTESLAATTNIPSDDQITLIHARLGHVATSTLFQIPKVSVISDSWRSTISGVYNGDIPPLGICEPCLEGKQTRLPYPMNTNPTTAPLQLVHSDTCNVPIASIKGYKDFVSFTDDWTCWSFIYFLPNKEAATILNAFKEFKAKVEVHFNRKIKAIRMDGGSEYKASMKDFILEMGINPEPSTHYSPESNGVSERLN